MSDPGKSYHLEIVLSTPDGAEQMRRIMDAFGLDAKLVKRKNHFVTYLKESEKITDFLGVIEAYKALMALENVRIVKNMRNNVNRQVNCETANINKTVSASMRQIEDINYIQDMIGLEKLAVPLQEIARIRLENPEAPLSELGTYLDPPVGKSGVNHRFRKLAELAEKIRSGEIR